MSYELLGLMMLVGFSWFVGGFVASNLLNEVKRRRFERALETQTSDEVDKEVQGPRPPPPTPINRKKED